jgi:hypothetical protein
VRAIEIRERMSKTAKKAFENPEIRKKLSDAAKAAWARRKEANM